MLIHDFLPNSNSNGPGSRFVLWVQGCNLNCPGCFNPDTHSFESGYRISVQQLLEKILTPKNRTEGITISGGEPLLQIKEVSQLVHRIKMISTLTVIIYTGFSWNEVQHLPGHDLLLENTDILITGRYLHEQRLAKGMLGSRNKMLHFLTPRYSPRDVSQKISSEIVIGKNGEISISGIDPVRT